MDIRRNTQELYNNFNNQLSGLFDRLKLFSQPQKYYSNKQVFEPETPDEVSFQKYLIRKNKTDNAFEPFVYDKFSNDKLLEGNIDRRYQQYINSKYNLADATKNAMRKDIAYNFTGDAYKNYGGMYYGQPAENEIMKMSRVPKGAVEIPGNQYNYYPADIGMHETIHAMNNRLGLNNNQNLRRQINNQIENNRDFGAVRFANNQIYENPELYNKTENDSLADERLAFIGSLGRRNIPPELMKYFLSIFN